MKNYLCALAVISSAGAAHAATLDFNSSAFETSYDGAAAVETVDGVTFTIAPTSRGANGFRQYANGIGFGVPGNGMRMISITADQDVVFESITGIDTSITSKTTSMLFDADAAGVSVFDDYAFGTNLGTFDFADFTLSAGDAFVISTDSSPRAGFNFVFASASLGEIAFSKPVVVPPAVPLPASMPFLLAGLGGFAAIRRKST